MLPRPMLSARSPTARIDLNDPAKTLALLDANAVVGVMPGASGGSRRSAFTCALCHSTVDNSFAPGIGRRLDGWPNRDLNVGAIIALAPDLSAVANLLQVDQATVRDGAEQLGTRQVRRASCSSTAKRSGPTARPRRRCCRPPSVWPASTCTPTPAGAACRTGTRSSPISRCMARARSTIRAWTTRTQFPVAARAGFGNVRHDADDGITSRLPALQFYQLAIPAPAAAARQLRRARGRSGQAVFNGAGALRDLPRAAALHRTGLGHAHRAPKSASTTSRPTDRRTIATARRRSTDCGRARRAASITTAASRRCSPSCSTTIGCSPQAQRPGHVRPGRISQVHLESSKCKGQSSK